MHNEQGGMAEGQWGMHHGHHGHHDHQGHMERQHGQHGCAMMPLAFLAISFVGILVAVRVANRQGFSTPAHGCFSDPLGCMLTMCCPCVAYGRVAQVSLGVPWYLMCATYACCHNFACCLGLASRHELRSKLNIEGHWCGDVCVHAFAQPCALCQELREVDMVARGERAGPVVTAVAVTAPAATFPILLPEGAVQGQVMQVDTPSGRVAFTVPQGVTAGQSINIQVNAPVAQGPKTQTMDIEMQSLDKPLMA